MQGSDPFYFHFIFYFSILKGASAPPFYLGTPDGGRILQNSHKHVPVLPYTTKLAKTRSSTIPYTTKPAKTRSSTIPYTTKLKKTRSSTTVYYKTRKTHEVLQLPLQKTTRKRREKRRENDAKNDAPTNWRRTKVQPPDPQL